MVIIFNDSNYYIMNVPSVCIENIITFLDAKTLPSVRSVCKDILLVVCSDAKIWKEKSDEIRMFGIKKLTKCNSNMITVLSMTDHVKNKTCFECGKLGSVYHDMYNVILCNDCPNKFFFKMVPFKKTCKEYFVKSETIESMDVPFIKHGNGKRVLEKHIKDISISINTLEGLELLEYKRHDNKRKRVENKHNSREFRINELYTLYHNRFDVYKHKIDNYFSDLDNVFPEAAKHKVIDMIGDLFQFKVKTKFSTQHASRALIDFAVMLTLMRSLEILDVNYNILPEYIYTVDIRHLLIAHVKGNCFVGNVNGIKRSYVELKNRASRMESYIFNNDLDITSRKNLCIMSCVEDDIDFDEYIFLNFINNEIGNPVEIARDKRMSIFLNKNGFMATYTELYEAGYSHETCRKYSRNAAVNNAGGIEIMHHVCIIDLPNLK